uniref:Pentraxin (PTX) domain-containing protein n=1 Tax=Colobus angolensis palliatus TaxID=336983 RepID=A0A2K5IZ50_COLAP
MGCLWRKTLFFFLVFVTVHLHGASSQEAAPAGPSKPFFERLRRLEEQFRRLQEVTLMHLQSIASSYNVSHNADVRFRSLAEESQAMAQAVNRSQAALQGELVQLKAWVRQLQRRSRKVDMRLRALDLALGERSQQQARDRKAHEAQGDALRDSLARLEGLVHSQGARLAALERWLPVAHPGTTALGPVLVPALTQPDLRGPSSLKLQRDRQELQAASEHRGPRQDSSAPLQGTREPPASGSHRVLSGTATAPKDPPQQAWSPRGPGEICGVGPTLVSPNASTKNVVFLSPGFVTALRAVSVCSWVRTASGRLGTLLSYATEDNDNKLVLHGRDSLLPGAIHFAIGDPAFRELPLQPLLDGQWHRACVITSTQGRYWLHVDRRLVATGSRFRQGYEIPPGGSLVLGQEQDSVGGGFDSSEAFVGSMSGLAIWDRALVPGEVANLAIGKEFPRGAILTLANAALAGGFVQRANCTCLERCP